MRHIVNPTTNHEHAGGSKRKGDGNGGDHIVTPFQVSVLGQVLEILLLLKEPLTWQKWCFCHPVWTADATGGPGSGGVTGGGGAGGSVRG